MFFWQQPLAVFIGAGLWGVGYVLLRDASRAVMLTATLMVPTFWLLGHFGYASPEMIVLGIGGVSVILVRHLTQLRAYDRLGGG